MTTNDQPENALTDTRRQQYERDQDAVERALSSVLISLEQRYGSLMAMSAFLELAWKFAKKIRAEDDPVLVRHLKTDIAHIYMDVCAGDPQ